MKETLLLSERGSPCRTCHPVLPKPAESAQTEDTNIFQSGEMALLSSVYTTVALAVDIVMLFLVFKLLKY